ncbi:MAG: sugar-binding protein [Granulosicoccus sp.]
MCGSDTNEIEGQYAWEIKVPLSSFGIERGVPFGFDVQIDLDHDGDARDARWAWFHPSRTTVDVSNTITDPSFMGTAVLSDEIDEPVLGFKRF